jgi:hypothetical protein
MRYDFEFFLSLKILFILISNEPLLNINIWIKSKELSGYLIRRVIDAKTFYFEKSSTQNIECLGNIVNKKL